MIASLIYSHRKRNWAKRKRPAWRRNRPNCYALKWKRKSKHFILIPSHISSVIRCRLKKLEEARQRRKIEREQAKHRLQMEIQENKQRRAQLKNSMAFFNHVRQTIDGIKRMAKDDVDWEKFMRCNGLPNANSPSDLRKYIHQWKMDVERRNRESRNWLLKTNERTLLTQDFTVPDLTKATLRKQQGNLGDVYAQRVKEILGVS